MIMDESPWNHSVAELIEQLITKKSVKVELDSTEFCSSFGRNSVNKSINSWYKRWSEQHKGDEGFLNTSESPNIYETNSNEGLRFSDVFSKRINVEGYSKINSGNLVKVSGNIEFISWSFRFNYELNMEDSHCGLIILSQVKAKDDSYAAKIDFNLNFRFESDFDYIWNELSKSGESNVLLDLLIENVQSYTYDNTKIVEDFHSIENKVSTLTCPIKSVVLLRSLKSSSNIN